MDCCREGKFKEDMYWNFKQLTADHRNYLSPNMNQKYTKQKSAITVTESGIMPTLEAIQKLFQSEFSHFDKSIKEIKKNVPLKSERNRKQIKDSQRQKANCKKNENSVGTNNTKVEELQEQNREITDKTE